MARVVFVLLILAATLAYIESSSCDFKQFEDQARKVQVRDEDVKHSAEFYYQLLVYIKENDLLDLGDCPRCKCFTDGTCVDLCDVGVWP